MEKLKARKAYESVRLIFLKGRFRLLKGPFGHRNWAVWVSKVVHLGVLTAPLLGKASPPALSLEREHGIKANRTMT